MKFVIIRRASTDILDGVNTFIFELSEALINRGHEVTTVTYHAKHSREEICKLFDLNKVPEVVTLSTKEFRGTLVYYIAWLIKGSKIINDIKPDLVLINGVVLLYLKTKAVIVCHGLFKGKWYHEMIARRLYRMFPLVCVKKVKARSH